MGARTQARAGRSFLPSADWLSWTWAAAPAVVLTFAHLSGGADSLRAGLLLSAAAGLLLLATLGPAGGAQRLGRIRALDGPGLAFAGVLIVAAWSLTPWVPGGPHPVWSFTPGLGASTLDRSVTLAEIVKLAGLAALVAAGAALGSSERLASRTYDALLIAGGVFALWSVSTMGAAAPVTFGRLFAGLPSANVAGDLFAALALMVLPRIMRRERSAPAPRAWERRIVALAPWLGLLALFTACLILTASRGALLCAGLAAGLFLALMVAGGRIAARWGLAGGLGAAALIAGLLLFKGQVAVERIGDEASRQDLGGRLPIFAAHWEAFLRSPLMGYGLGTFDAVNKINLQPAQFDHLWPVRATHNVYLQWLEEAGIIGAAPMFLAVALMLIAIVRGLLRQRRMRAWICALLAVDVLILAHGTTDFALQVPSVAAFWSLLLGLQLGGVAESGGRRGA